MKRQIKQLLCCFLVVAVLLMVQAPAWMAPIDSTETGTITVVLIDPRDGTTRINNVLIAIYRIGEVTSYTAREYGLIEPYKTAYPNTDLNNLDNTSAQSLANSIAAYITRNRNTIAPLATQSTNSRGETTFSGLDLGVYLAVLYDNTTLLRMQPTIVFIPYTADSGVTWEYTVPMDVKLSWETTTSSTPGTTTSVEATTATTPVTTASTPSTTASTGSTASNRTTGRTTGATTGGDEEIPDESIPLDEFPPDDWEDIPDDDVPLAPYTGDTFNIVIYGVTGAVSLAGLLLIVLLPKKKKS